MEELQEVKTEVEEAAKQEEHAAASKLEELKAYISAEYHHLVDEIKALL